MAIVNCTKIKPKKRVADRCSMYGDLFVGDLLDPEQCRELELQEIKRMICNSRLLAYGYRYLLLDPSIYDDLRGFVLHRFDGCYYEHYVPGPVPRSTILGWFDLRWCVEHATEYGESDQRIFSVTLSPNCAFLLRDYLKYLFDNDILGDDLLVLSCADILMALED